jgi:hypothetical protein
MDLKYLRGVLVAGGLLGLGLVAVDALSSHTLIARTFAAVPLSDAELQDRLRIQGFSNVQNIRREGNRAVLMATKDGQEAQITVDSRTGQIAHGNGDDDDD